MKQDNFTLWRGPMDHTPTDLRDKKIERLEGENEWYRQQLQDYQTASTSQMLWWVSLGALSGGVMMLALAALFVWILSK